ncbi:MAG TPA: leucyl/phenylalanyl-tRNA--protein transferase [Actinomycetota bacterium]|nr:leucyl/phenylalanyl-tRNA--protein transferase [Actinomycetota bacterium]
MVIEDRESVGYSRAVDADLLIAGYRKGLFVMACGGNRYQWWSPNPRGILPLEELRVPRSLRRSVRRYEVTFDADFESVVGHCADPARRGGWIDRGLAQVYLELHRRGYAHSVECWDPAGALAGGLFGVNIGGFFSGESMFHVAPDASKVALVALVERLRAASQPVLLDTQWRTEHLASLGVVEVPRAEYLRRLAAVVDLPMAL